MGMTVVEKILARASGRTAAHAGEVLEPKVDLAMSHENAALVVNQFVEIFSGTGREPRIWDPDRVAVIFDHRVPAESAMIVADPMPTAVTRPPESFTKYNSSPTRIGEQVCGALRFHRQATVAGPVPSYRTASNSARRNPVDK